MQGTGDDFREPVRSSTNLVDLVAETVTLKPLHGGRQYVGLCPFHDDHNPSFYVYPDRQSYRCWVCQQGGDCFRWVMEIEKLSFPEAMESLARRARLEIPKRGRGGAGADVPGKAAALEIVEWAANLMHEALRTGRMAEHAREYVEKRRLTAETVRNFRLGYHPEDRYWLMDRARGKYTPAQLVSAGLLRERDEGQGYSAMDLADRLIDHRGELGAEHLERDAPVVPEILGQIHGGHPALPQLPLDPVAVGQGRDRAEGGGVEGHRKLPPDEEIELRGGELVRAGEVDRMGYKEEVVVVVLDLRERAGLHAVLDRERVELEHGFQDESGFLRRGIVEIDPQQQSLVGSDQSEGLRLEVLSDELAVAEHQGADHDDER